MAYIDNSFKLVTVLNRRVDLGAVTNALEHVVAGLVAADRSAQQIEFLDYPTQSGWQSLIARHPIIVLRSENSNQLRRLHAEALELDIMANAFVQTMLGESAIQQQAATRNAAPDELEYWAVAVFGEAERLKSLTKRFSLYA